MTTQSKAKVPNDLNYDTLYKAVTHDVSEILSAKAARGRNVIIGVGALLVPVIIAGGAVLVPSLISGAVNDAVNMKFEESVGKELRELHFLRELGTLERYIKLIEPGKPSVLSDLRTVQKRVQHIKDTYLSGSDQNSNKARELNVLLNDWGQGLFGSFAVTPAPGQVALFIASFNQITEFEPRDIQIGVQALGRELIGARGGAEEWQKGNGDIAEMFPVYYSTAERARQSSYPELTLLFELIRLHMEDSAHDDIPLLLQELGTLQEQDRAIYVDLMSDFLTQEWHPRPDAFSARIAQRAEALIADHLDHPVMIEVVNEALQDGYDPSGLQ